MDDKINLDINVDNSDIKSLGVEFNKVDQTVQLLVDHLSQVENKIVNLKNVTRNVTQNIQSTTNKGPVFNGSSNTIIGPNGTAVSGTSTRTRAYKNAADDLHKYQLEEIEILKKKVEYEKAITDYKRTQIQYYKQDSTTQFNKSQAQLLKSQYYNTAEHLNYEQALASKHNNLSGWYIEKSLHPEKFLPGSQLHSVRYQTGRGFNMVGDTISSLGAGGKVLGGILKTIGDFVKAPYAGTATAVATLVKGVTDLGKAAGKAYSEIEAIKTQLGVVFGNQVQAESTFGQISEYAVHSPFGVQQTSELAVLLKQSGVYATDLMDTLKMLGDTAGGNMEKMKRIANNYAQIVSIGKASMLDMRQFAYAGIPIFEAVSKELKVSQQELRKMISDGQVTSDIIEKVFKDLTGINGIFENATEKGAKTLKARLQNLADAKQLAMGAVGEYGVNFGTTYGNDSYVNGIVSGIEGIYQWLKDKVNTVNIENSVEVIKNQQKYIKELEKQIADAEKKGKFAEAEELKLQLEKMLGLSDIDKNRSTLNKSYENKNNHYEDLKGRLESSALYANMRSMWSELGYSDKNQFTLRDYQTVADMFGLDSMSLIIKELIKAEENLAKITNEETQAHKEANVINAQQLAFDQASKAAGNKMSYASGFEKLYSLYTSQDEYKQKKEEEELEWLKSSKEVLKELLSFRGKDGSVDLTKLTYKKLIEYLDEEKRVLDEGRKLTVVRGKSQETMTADRQILEAQYKNIYAEVENQLGLLNPSARNELGRLNRQINYGADNNMFFQQFARVLDDELSIFDDLIANAKDEDKNTYKNMRKALMASTFAYNAPSEEGLNADLTKAANQFIPLWKRILAGATGLTTNGMTDTISTMTNYRDDMAVRNMTKDVLRAAMKSMGYDAAMGLVRSGQAARLKGDNGLTFQTDWQSTRKAIKEFALSLRASTEVVEAYRKGLQAELDTYTELIALAPTQEESQDLKNQKTVSAKTLSKLSGDQLVNAFGEVLETASGKKYKASEITFDESGKMFDSFGNEIKEEVVLTGKLFDFIKGELPRIRKELTEADAKVINQTEFDKLVNDAISKQIPLRALESEQKRLGYISPQVSQRIDFLQQNPEYAKKMFDTYFQEVIDSHKNDPKYYWLRTTDENDEHAADNVKSSILSWGLMRSPEFLRERREKGWNTESEELASELLNEVAAKILKSLQGPVLGVGNTETNHRAYQTISDNQATLARDLNLLTRFLEQRGGSYKAEDLKPRNYGGLRGFRNTIYELINGTSLASDQEDFLAFTLRNDRLSVQDINAKRKANYEKLSDFEKNQTKLELINEDDLNPLVKTNEQLAKMLTLSERISLLWGTEGKDIGKALNQIGTSAGSMVANFTSDAISSSFELWGKYLKDSSKASSEIAQNLGELSANLLKNLGSMVTQAGLSLAISSVGDKKRVLAGLAIAAAGGGLSFLGGALGGSLEDDNSKSDSEYEKLLRIKQDLADLLKQAREDAIYYENTVRHKKAISANENFTKAVHDAVITPRGDVVTTDPKDYLIATKTPKTLVGGGAPTINFSVVDKSTGIKVTQQRSTYDEATNTIEFEAIIESKVQEIIATSKGDEAFSAREARLNGRTVIA